MPCEWIGQRQIRDCGVAALAMLTGKSYEAIAAYFRNPDFSVKGLYLVGIDDYLADHGFAVARKKRYLGFFHDDKAPPREPWPPEPFAEMHLCEVKVNEKSPVYHFVVMLRDGSCLDPLTPERKRLSDYHQVLNVAGVFRVR